MGNTTGIMADAIAPPVKVYIVWNDYALKKPDTYRREPGGKGGFTGYFQVLPGYRKRCHSSRLREKDSHHVRRTPRGTKYSTRPNWVSGLPFPVIGEQVNNQNKLLTNFLLKIKVKLKF